MCGIFAISLNRPLGYEDVALGQKASAILSHRGPDGNGEWMDRGAGVYLGHRRLSIIDLSDDSSQPMILNDLVITYNGEIYNYLELRNELTGLGHRFKTSGDTEVLIRAWMQWGPSALDRIDGMFAFVIYDGVNLHIAVDPFGEKPLYWAETTNGIYISSELKPLVDLLGISAEPSPDAIAAFFSLGNFPAPLTAFPNIKRMPAASLMTLQAGKAGAIKRYWTAPIPEPGRGPVTPLSDSELDRIQLSLADSLSRRMRADVPVALFLSAGIDSSLVAAIAARDLGMKVDCLSVSFQSSNVTDEAPLAETIAHYLNLPHTTLCGEDCNVDVISQLRDIFSHPNDNVTAISVRQLSKLAATHYKVALTGVGGDEIVAGYNKHVLLYENAHWYKVPQIIRSALGAFLRGLPYSPQKLKNFRDLYLVRNDEFYLALKNFPAIDWLRSLPGFHSWANSTFGDLCEMPYLQVMAYELRQGMADEHLLTYDLGSMSASVELRTPFLCRDVVETIAEMDARSLVAFGQKNTLRQLLKRYLPEEMIDHPKRGFVFPREHILKDACKPDVSWLPASAVSVAWEKRHQSPNWSRMGIRLLVAAAFCEGTKGK